MYSNKINTCRYCEYLFTKFCPFSAKGVKTEKTVDSDACSQFMALSDLSRFHERRYLDQMLIVKQKQHTPSKKLKRALDI